MPLYSNTCPDCGTYAVITRGVCHRCRRKRLRDGTLTILTDVDRFWGKVRKDPNGCWTWTTQAPNHRYGSARWGGKSWMAHRLSWAIHRGPIPDGMEVCHDCPGGDNSFCVNPDHLFLGTHDDNMKDMARKGRWRPHGLSGTGMGRAAKLTEAQAIEALAAYRAGGVTQREIAGWYGVEQTTISFLTRRVTWKHLA